MSKIYNSSVILEVLGFLDPVEQIHAQLISRRFYDKIIPILFHHFKMNIKNKIVRCKSGQTEYITYNFDSVKTNIYNDEEEELPFKELVHLEQMKMQFPLNHKHALTQDNRLFVIGGTFNLTNSYRQTYEILANAQIVERRGMVEPRNSFGCIAVSTSVVVMGGYFSLKRTLCTCEIYNSVEDRWAMLPPMNEERALTSACQFDNYIYCFGGASDLNKKFHNMIERMDISTIDHNKVDEKALLFELDWEIINLNSTNTEMYGYNFGWAQMNTAEILLFGGNIPDPENPRARFKVTRSTMVFNTKDNTLKKYEGDNTEEEGKLIDVEEDRWWLLEPDAFYHNDQICYKNKIYAHGKEGFHVFNCINKNWENVHNYKPQVSHVNTEHEPSIKKARSIQVTRNLLPLNLL